jgi:hypothetical protein
VKTSEGAAECWDPSLPAALTAPQFDTAEPMPRWSTRLRDEGELINLLPRE